MIGECVPIAGESHCGVPPGASFQSAASGCDATRYSQARSDKFRSPPRVLTQSAPFPYFSATTPLTVVFAGKRTGREFGDSFGGSRLTLTTFLVFASVGSYAAEGLTTIFTFCRSCDARASPCSGRPTSAKVFRTLARIPRAKKYSNSSGLYSRRPVILSCAFR